MAAAKGACLNHVSRESPDVKRLAKFYMELHLIERDPNSKLPEGPWSSASAVADPKNLPRGHHVCIYVPNFDSFVQSLKEKGIEVHERSQPDGKTKQAFFFDPDGEPFLHYQPPKRF
ncbi:hypothetical protein DH2020_036018 [Rehmannia glutinosa]|uniref:VOC domain-containing protein n=1 Tax=Rehmannia glutinosa TaxID=99300 RepID=A0ABR0V4Q2_REHGL